MINLNTPEHYNWNLDVKVIDIIKEVIKDKEGIEAFYIANALKYLIRAEKKGQPIEDYKKVIWYCNAILNERGDTDV